MSVCVGDGNDGFGYETQGVGAAGDVLYVPRTFIGDVGAWVRLYIRGILPIEPVVGAGTIF